MLCGCEVLGSRRQPFADVGRSPATALVNLDAEGRPDSIRFEALCAHFLMALKDLDRRLAALEAAAGGVRL